MSRAATWTVAAGLAVVLAVCGFGVIVLAALTGGGCPTAVTTSPTRWNEDQVGHASTIVAVGARMRVAPYGWVVAVATAIQESGLRNLGYLGERNDHDSLGLFQQRPSQGWGTPAQVTDPTYAATAYYTRLLQVPGWQQLPVTDAAQAVQRSAYPHAYAKHEADARHLVATVASTTAGALSGDRRQCLSIAGWVAPVAASVGSGFRTADRPGHEGVDLSAARGTPIRAAAAGTVVIVTCNVTPASWGCDRDGNPSILGCGWYVDIRHWDDVVTRYCHLATRPVVTVGQTVTAGQVIGQVGSSGNSSGPHLHFEVRLISGGGAATAVDPVPFMQDRLAPLGPS